MNDLNKQCIFYVHKSIYYFDIKMQYNTIKFFGWITMQDYSVKSWMPEKLNPFYNLCTQIFFDCIFVFAKMLNWSVDDMHIFTENYKIYVTDIVLNEIIARWKL